MREGDTGVRCPSCARALDSFIFRLVDLHPHRAARPPDDGLTGLPTHHALHEHLHGLLGNREEAKLPMLFVDIDGLVWITDRFGYKASDEAIQRIANWLVALAQAERGRVFRVGGDEFLLVFPDASQESVQSLGRRIVDECPTLGIPYERPNDARKVATVSVIAFWAGAELADGIREVTKHLAQTLYEAEVKVNRDHSVFIALDAS
jgi:diguanylate cyclase (GGDEF)-like protein